MTLALAGNPNCGKTTLFNRLTGARQRVGNWPGVTVEKKQGLLPDQNEIVDLPGIYSLSPYTLEEVLARDFCLSGAADGILNIVDVTHLERNLYLSLQLAELGKPMVVALNMMDELRQAGGFLLADVLEQGLGVPVVPISARTGEGVGPLLRRMKDTVRRNRVPVCPDFTPKGPFYETVHALSFLMEEKAAAHGYTPRFIAIKLLEGDAPTRDALALSPNESQVVAEVLSLLETKTGLDAYACLADARYVFIEDLVRRCLLKGKPPEEQTLSHRADRILLGRFTGIPLFLLLLGAVFFLTFGPLGRLLGQGMTFLLEQIRFGARIMLSNADEWTQSLLLDGILPGLSAVLSFMPVILLLFLGLSLLEDSGYMARASYLLDKPMRSVGLSGKSFLPMVLGFGCTVPAVLACRTLENDRDRRLTIFLTPFMSCGAKAPLYALFAAAFFPRHGALAMAGVYIIGVLTAVLSGILLQSSKAFAHNRTSPFLMELPPYRIPSARTVVLLLWQKTKGFLYRAFTLILGASAVIWFLSSFDARLLRVDSAHSMLARLSTALAWFFEPLGFGRWEWVTAVLAGFSAKEAVVSTLGVLYDAEQTALPGVLGALPGLGPAAAMSFMAFNLLCVPCAAALAAIRKELGGGKWLLASVGFQTAAAWVVSFIVFQFGRVLERLF